MNYCYASGSSHAEGDGFTGIFKIINGQRETVICKGQAITDNNFHNIEVKRIKDMVILKVDGKEMCRARDNAFIIKGKIGIGSYNDMACFDDINISGKYETIKE